MKPKTKKKQKPHRKPGKPTKILEKRGKPAKIHENPYDHLENPRNQQKIMKNMRPYKEAVPQLTSLRKLSFLFRTQGTYLTLDCFYTLVGGGVQFV